MRCSLVQSSAFVHIASHAAHVDQCLQFLLDVTCISQTSDFLRMLGVIGGEGEGTPSAEEALTLTHALRPGRGARLQYAPLVDQMVFHPGKAARGAGVAPALQRAAARMTGGSRSRMRKAATGKKPGGRGTGRTAVRIPAPSGGAVPRPPGASPLPLPLGKDG